jgi:hypothetical protein
VHVSSQGAETTLGLRVSEHGQGMQAINQLWSHTSTTLNMTALSWWYSAQTPA